MRSPGGLLDGSLARPEAANQFVNWQSLALDIDDLLQGVLHLHQLGRVGHHLVVCSLYDDPPGDNPLGSEEGDKAPSDYYVVKAATELPGYRPDTRRTAADLGACLARARAAMLSGNNGWSEAA